MRGGELLLNYYNIVNEGFYSCLGLLIAGSRQIWGPICIMYFETVAIVLGLDTRLDLYYQSHWYPSNVLLPETQTQSSLYSAHEYQLEQIFARCRSIQHTQMTNGQRITFVI